MHLKNERFIKNRTEILPLNFGFKFLLLVRKHVDFNVGVRGAPDVHRRKVLSLKDSNYELNKKTLKNESLALQGKKSDGCEFLFFNHFYIINLTL